MDAAKTRINGTCVAIDGEGILFRGASGSGKSDLALRLIDAGARLVADDWTEASVRDGRVRLAAPGTIAGLIEVRGLGVIETTALAEAPLALVVDLADPSALERMPAPAVADIAGVAVPSIRIAPFEDSAVAKVRAALSVVLGRTRIVP